MPPTSGTERGTLRHATEISQLLRRRHLLLSELRLGVEPHATSLEAHFRKALTAYSFLLGLLTGSTRAKELGLTRDIDLCLGSLRASLSLERSSLVT